MKLLTLINATFYKIVMIWEKQYFINVMAFSMILKSCWKSRFPTKKLNNICDRKKKTATFLSHIERFQQGHFLILVKLFSIFVSIVDFELDWLL